MSIEIRPIPRRLRNDLTSKTFGKWTILGYAGTASELGLKGEHRHWLCRCECCGTERTVSASNLISGKSTNCGNLDGRTSHPLHRTLADMKTRCYNKNAKNYQWYGGRGIKIDPLWINDFWKFVEDMGPRPSPSHSIDRIDNNGDYAPGNCRWSSQSEQTKNMRSNRYITASGETKLLAEWANEIGVLGSVISNRIKRGWCEECAVTVKPRESRCQHNK